jgi:outer membrane lipoprotein-sorting protein
MLGVGLGLAQAASHSDSGPWTFEAEQTIVSFGGDDPGSSRTTVHIWFTRGQGWRAETTTVGTDGTVHRILGYDGGTLWIYDPDINQYTLDTQAGLGDPRILDLAGEGGLPLTYDLQSALAISDLYPNSTSTREGKGTVAGRPTERLRIVPTCATGNSNNAANASGRRCDWSVEYWLDEETGWALRVEATRATADDGSYLVDTGRAVFGGDIDRALCTFTPPPGSERVTHLP